MNLVLSSYGATLIKKDGLFHVQTADSAQFVNPADVKTITISKAARISSDAVLLAIEHEIDVMFVDHFGKPRGRVWSVNYGSVSTRRKKQLEFLYSPKSIDWIKKLVAEKVNNQVALLLSFKDECAPADRRRIDAAVNSMEDHRQKILAVEGDVISDVAPSIRGWEGAASRRYYESLNYFLPETFRFEKRTQHPAKDRFNSMLNYGYGILYGKIEGSLIKAGIDPYLGIFHRDEYNRPALVFDIIEKFRIWIDYVMLRLAQQNMPDVDSFKIENEQVWLEGLGKRIVIQSVNDYLLEIIEIKGLQRSRGAHIEMYAQELAQMFLKA